MTTIKLANEAVTEAKLGNLAVATGKLANLAVTAAKLGNESVETGKLQALAVTTAKLAANAVETAKIKDGAVTEPKLGDGAATSRKVKPTFLESAEGELANLETEWADICSKEFELPVASILHLFAHLTLLVDSAVTSMRGETRIVVDGVAGGVFHKVQLSGLASAVEGSENASNSRFDASRPVLLDAGKRLVKLQARDVFATGTKGARAKAIFEGYVVSQ